MEGLDIGRLGGAAGGRDHEDLTGDENAWMTYPPSETSLRAALMCSLRNCAFSGSTRSQARLVSAIILERAALEKDDGA